MIFQWALLLIVYGGVVVIANRNRFGTHRESVAGNLWEYQTFDHPA